jgi:hypothetical protein
VVAEPYTDVAVHVREHRRRVGATIERMYREWGKLSPVGRLE